MKTWPILVAGGVTVVAFISYAALLLAASWPIEDWSIHKASLFGDSFGMLNSFFTGGAFLLILWTIVLQQAELRLQRQEMSRMVATHTRELHMELLNYAFHDEELAEVWGSEIDNWKEFRQDMYINLILGSWCMHFSEGLSSKSATRQSLEWQMQESAQFRRFWARNSEKWHALALDDQKYHKSCQLAEAAYQAAVTKAREEGKEG